MAFHCTWHSLTVPHIAECWPECGLIRLQHVATIITLRCIQNNSDKSSRANQNKHLIFNFFFFFWKSCLLWDNVENTVEPDRPQMAVWHIRIACWIIEATDRHSVYVIFIVFPLQHWLHERTSALRYTHIACLSSG